MTISNEIQQLLQASANLGNTLALIVTSIGIFIAIRSYRAERERERQERAYGTFDDLDNKYVEFMYKCTEYPHLDFFSIPAPRTRTVSENDLLIERAMFSVLISIFERAFLMFERHADDDVKDRQYLGWVECMRSYCTRESFLHEWNKIGTQFDAGFQVEMNSLIAEESKN